MPLVDRPLYTDRTLPFIGTPTIKVINMESLEFEFISSYQKLYDHVKRCFTGAGPPYLFVDEVQNIDQWERAIASIQADGIADVTITGSSARLLSSDLATLLTGRYVEIETHPLRFSEFIRFREAASGDVDSDEAWKQFLRFGGFRGIHYLRLEDEPVFTYLNSLYNTIVLKDVVSRHEIREPAQLDLITRFLFDKCGNITTAKRIADYLEQQKVKATVGRVQNYPSFLESALLVHRCRRYDLRGLRHQELYDKFYMADVGIRHGLIGYRDSEIAGLLENVVYLELLARGYRVSVGRYADCQIDFVAESQKERLYVQVCYLLASDDMIEREYGSLERIRDNYPKIVLSMDSVQPVERSGIIWRNPVNFLLTGQAW